MACALPAFIVAVQTTSSNHLLESDHELAASELFATTLEDTRFRDPKIYSVY